MSANHDCDNTACNGNCDSCQENITVTLTLDDDTVVECAILTIFEVNEKDYIALLPLDEDGKNEDGEVYLYSYTESENGSPVLGNIEDDDEYEAVADKFDEMLDSMEYDELIEADEE